MVWKEIAHIRGDKLTVRLMIFPVFAQIFILGYALVTEIKNTPVIAYDLSNSPASVALIEEIRNSPLFNWKGYAQSYDDVKVKIDGGYARIGLIIPADFNRALQMSGGARVQLLVDGQDANSSNVASGYIGAILSKWGTDRLRDDLRSKGINLESMLPVKVNPVVLFNPMLKSTWYMMTALVVLLVTIVTSLLSGLSIVKEKESGTLEQLMVTPVKPIQLIFGKTVPYLLIGIGELCVFLLLTTLWFAIPFRGSFFIFLLFGIVYMISSLGIGILTSTIARTPQQVLFLTWFILIFFILLSGFFIPIDNMPPWVRKITVINPVRYFMFAVREMFLKGSGLRELWPDLLKMFSIGVVVFSSSILLFHRRTK